MRQITEEVTDLVLEYGGSLSGEHGDGLARSEWNQKMFGPVVYEAFREVKQAFDPHGLLNPGKVVDAPPMTENLRYRARLSHRPSRRRFSTTANRRASSRSVEMCNGNGACRKQKGGDDVPVLTGRRSTSGTARAAGPMLCGSRSAGRTVNRTPPVAWSSRTGFTRSSTCA